MTSNLRAGLWMLGSVVAFSAMAVAGKQVTPVHDSFEIMTLRSAVGLILVLVLARATGQMSEIKAQRLTGHFFRNILHFAGQNLWFFALTLIPLAQLFALEFTSPIWLLLLSVLFLGERLTLPRVSSVALGFVGILIVTRPTVDSLNIGVFAALAAAFFFACTAVATKKLTLGQSILTIMFWLTVMQLCFGLILTFYDGQVTWPTASTLPWLILIGVCGVVAHYSLTAALSLAPATYVMPIDFLRLPLISVLAAVIYFEPLDPFVILGGAVIFAGIWINIRADLAKSTLSPAS